MKKNILTFLCFLNILIAQTDEIIRKASQASGFNESEIRQMAKERNMSDSDIQLEAEKRGFSQTTSRNKTTSSNNNSTRKKIDQVEKVEDAQLTDSNEKPEEKIKNNDIVQKVKNDESLKVNALPFLVMIFLKMVLQCFKILNMDQLILNIISVLEMK